MFNLKKSIPANQSLEIGAVGYGTKAANDSGVVRGLVIGAAVMAASTMASAAAGAAVDVTDTVATIGAQLVPVGLIGVAVLGIVVAVKAFKWVRAALS